MTGGQVRSEDSDNSARIRDRHASENPQVERVESGRDAPRRVGICVATDFRDRDSRHDDLTNLRRATYDPVVAYLGLFRDRVQFCSGLVDLVVCVRRHGGGCHRLTLARERFIGRIAENIAQVGDRGRHFREARGEGVERATDDSGRRLVTSEPVEKSGEHRQGGTDKGDVAGVVAVADRRSEVIETRTQCRRAWPRDLPERAPDLTR